MTSFDETTWSHACSVLCPMQANMPSGASWSIPFHSRPGDHHSLPTRALGYDDAVCCAGCCHPEEQVWRRRLACPCWLLIPLVSLLFSSSFLLHSCYPIVVTSFSSQPRTSKLFCAIHQKPLPLPPGAAFRNLPCCGCAFLGLPLRRNLWLSLIPFLFFSSSAARKTNTRAALPRPDSTSLSFASHPYPAELVDSGSLNPC